MITKVDASSTSTSASATLRPPIRVSIYDGIPADGAPLLREYLRPFGAIPPSLPELVTNSLDDAFSWPRHYFDRIEKCFPPGILADLRDKHQLADRSGAYCGIDAMGVADNMICHALSQKLGVPLQPLRFRAAVEWDGYCQQELADMPSPPDHIFGDIKSFFKPGPLRRLLAMQQKGITVPLSALLPLVKSGRAVSRSAWCVTHNKICVHPRCTIHQGSPACTDMSQMGGRAGLDGSTMIDFAAWCCMRLEMEDRRN
jgi:hypothetical protein